MAKANAKTKRWWTTQKGALAAIGAVATLIGAVAGLAGAFKGSFKSEAPTPAAPTVVINNTVSTQATPVSTPVEDPNNLLKNGSFEMGDDGLKYWGTGTLELQNYHGSLPPFWASWKSSVNTESQIVGTKVADLRGEVVSDVHHSGSKSFKITHNSPVEPHVYGSMSQQINGLEKNGKYRVSFWVKAERAIPGTLEISTTPDWWPRIHLPPGTYDWTQFSEVVDVKESSYVDLRLISSSPGTVWIDDISFARVFDK